jgi:hypothetical protein
MICKEKGRLNTKVANVFTKCVIILVITPWKFSDHSLKSPKYKQEEFLVSRDLAPRFSTWFAKILGNSH